MAKKAVDIRLALIDAGVKNLKEFGYPHVNRENILTDYIYASFFESMLDDNLGKGFDDTIKRLIEEVGRSKQPIKRKDKQISPES